MIGALRRYLGRRIQDAANFCHRRRRRAFVMPLINLAVLVHGPRVGPPTVTYMIDGHMNVVCHKRKAYGRFEDVTK